MNPLYGTLSTSQRDTLASAAQMLAPLPIPGARDLATHLACISQTRRPTPAQVTDATTLATSVHRALVMETSPDRWIDEVSTWDPHQASQIVADLVAQRRAQAEQLSTAAAVLTVAIPAATTTV